MSYIGPSCRYQSQFFLIILPYHHKYPSASLENVLSGFLDLCTHIAPWLLLLPGDDPVVMIHLSPMAQRNQHSFWSFTSWPYCFVMASTIPGWFGFRCFLFGANVAYRCWGLLFDHWLVDDAYAIAFILTFFSCRCFFRRRTKFDLVHLRELCSLCQDFWKMACRNQSGHQTPPCRVRIRSPWCSGAPSL